MHAGLDVREPAAPQLAIARARSAERHWLETLQARPCARTPVCVGSARRAMLRFSCTQVHMCLGRLFLSGIQFAGALIHSSLASDNVRGGAMSWQSTRTSRPRRSWPLGITVGWSSQSDGLSLTAQGATQKGP